MITTANGYIRFAIEEDMKKIHQWLEIQNRTDVHGTFLCNWNLTKEVYDEGNIIVYIDNESNEPIAYMWSDFGIIEVRENKRGKGIGRSLVDFAIKHAIELGEVVIKIECAPLSSIPFWKRMGFNFYTHEYAYMLLNKEYHLPNMGSPVVVDIRFYPECKKWKPETEPLERFSPIAVKTPEGHIYFKNRVSIFTESHNWNYDPVVEINIDGKRLYMDKAKYLEAYNLGVIRSSYAFSIERLVMCFN